MKSPISEALRYHSRSRTVCGNVVNDEFTRRVYTKPLKVNKPSPMRCESVSPTWGQTIINAIALPVTLLIFKSGLNRIFLTVGSSTDEVGAATPDKVFLMLEVLPEIQTNPQVKSSS